MERWLSGRKRRLAKPLYLFQQVPWVRIPPSPPVLNFRIFRHDPPRIRKPDVQDGIGFRAERPEDFPRRRDGGHVRRKDRDECGLGFLDGRKGAGLLRIFRSLEGRACGRAAARPSARRGRIARKAFRTRRGLRRVRLTRSAFFRQIPNRKNQVLALCASADVPASCGKVGMRRGLGGS